MNNNSMAHVIDIILRLLASPNKKVKDILTEADIECLRKTVGGKDKT